jgi:hypothetical protein
MHTHRATLYRTVCLVSMISALSAVPSLDCGGDGGSLSDVAAGRLLLRASSEDSTLDGGGCTCDDGGDSNGNAVDPASTYCGFTVCGGDFNEWTCEASGWIPTGTPCGTCSCSDGGDLNGNPIPADATYCGFTVCGGDLNEWTCEASGWTPTGTACGGCTCYGGGDSNGNAVDPASTYCGFTVCGGDFSEWTCEPSGWSLTGTTCSASSSSGSSSSSSSSSGSDGGCTCYGGGDSNGNAVDPASTYCGFTVCGGDFNQWTCEAMGWTPTGAPCSGSSSSSSSSSGSSSSGSDAGCTCYGGGDSNGNPVDPASTYCGSTVCGGDFNVWTCEASGWTTTGTPCSG